MDSNTTERDGTPMPIKIKNVISAETRDRLLWCLAVQAQGPTAALTFTPRHQPRAQPSDLAAERPGLRLSKGTRADLEAGVTPPLGALAPTRIHGKLAA
jgi:hypothetical protein